LWLFTGVNGNEDEHQQHHQKEKTQVLIRGRTELPRQDEARPGPDDKERASSDKSCPVLCGRPPDIGRRTTDASSQDMESGVYGSISGGSIIANVFRKF
jgi:hypothetical protein